jgi:hypothetical protein
MDKQEQERGSGQAPDTKTKVTAYLPTGLVRFAQHYAVDEDTSLTAILSTALEDWAAAHGYVSRQTGGSA